MRVLPLPFGHAPPDGCSTRGNRRGSRTTSKPYVTR